MWYERLRWLAIGGHLIALSAAWLAGFAFDVAAAAAIVGAEVLSAVVLARLPTVAATHQRRLVVVMLADALALIGLLYLSGGPHNPFSVVIMVNVALAAVLLRPRAALVVTALTLGLSALLFVRHQPLLMRGGSAHHEHAMSMELHLYGMWAGYGIAGAVLIGFLTRLRAQLASAAAALRRSEETAARATQQARLATVAAGAAHELATPLASIAVAARELERMLPPDGEAHHDAVTIRQQVVRCREVLDQMALGSGAPAAGAFREERVSALLSAMRDHGGERLRCDLSPEVANLDVLVHGDTLNQALRNLLDNALQAGAPDGVVTCGVRCEGNQLCFEIRDTGTGMAPDVLERVGEPFFSTRPAGQGLGLGVFVARSVAEQMGGSLEVASGQGEGTTVRLRIPSNSEVSR